jgi:hypothetical protein
LRIITYFSLFGFFLISFLSLDFLGFSLPTGIFSVFVVFCCSAHLLLFQNPHIVDAFCHMCTAIMLYSLLRASAVSYGTAAVAGVLSHEMALFTVPSFLATGRWRASLAVIVVSFGAFIGSHLVIGGESVFYELPAFKPAIFVEAYLAWGIAWVPIIAGLFLCRAKYLLPLSLMFLFAMAGALIASVLSRGAIRMIASIMPVGVILVAFFIANIERSRRIFLYIYVTLIGIGVMFAIPTNITSFAASDMKELEDFYLRFKYEIILFHVIGIASGLLLVWTMRDTITSNLKRNLRFFSGLTASRNSW